MNGDTLQNRARKRADELPGTGLEHPFGPTWEVYKVRGKVFMLMTEVAGDPIVILKADPQDAEALRHAYDDITPGYHMNKKHWITLSAGGMLPERLLDELVLESYQLVVENLPRTERPYGIGKP